MRESACMRVVSESRATRQAQAKSERVRERARWKCNDRSNELKKARAKKVHGEREWCESGAVHRAGTSMIRKKERKRERKRSSGRGCGGGGTHRDCEIKSQGTVAFLNVNQTKITHTHTHTHRLSEINATEINHKPNIY